MENEKPITPLEKLYVEQRRYTALIEQIVNLVNLRRELSGRRDLTPSGPYGPSVAALGNGQRLSPFPRANTGTNE